MNGTSNEHALLLATLPPPSAQTRAAFAIIAIFIAAFAITVPFASTPLPRLDAWIPAFTTALVITDLITAALLFSQYSIVRQPALLVLAIGYLFSGLTIVPYALTFPGVFAPTGLLGAGLQTAVWLYLVWHMASPLSVIVYELLKGADGKRAARRPARVDIGLSIALTIAAVCVLTWLCTAQHDLLPKIYLDRTSLAPLANAVAGLVFLLCAISVVLLLLRRESVLDLWLMVAVWAWLLEITLQGIFLTDRFSLAWYVGRVFSLIAGSLVLIVLLSEMTTLYAHLARSVMRQRAARQARQIAMDTMAASIAHEVSQPLAAIALNARSALIYLAATTPNTDEARAAIEDIAISSARGTQVIESLRAMFRKDAARKASFDINNLVREVVAILDINLRAERVSVSTSLREGLPQPLADHGQLQQVFLNLIMNAIDAMRPVTDRARELRITSDFIQATSEILVTVEDSGTGVGDRNAERIFEPFFTTKPTGTGIGLNICRSIIGAHGGSLRAVANRPFGTIFEVIVPIECVVGDEIRLVQRIHTLSVVPAKAGTHTLRAREGHWRSSTSEPARRMGPRFREDDPERTAPIGPT